MKGWLAPHTMLCKASAKLKAETEMPRSAVTGLKNRPRPWRRPMHNVKIAALTSSSIQPLWTGATRTSDIDRLRRDQRHRLE